MALSITITDQNLKETAGLLGGLDEALWPSETDWQKIRDEGLRQVKNDLTQSGIDPDDIDDDDEALKYALIYKTLSILFYGLMRRPGDTWEERSIKAETSYSSNLRASIITLSTGSTTKVGQGRATR